MQNKDGSVPESTLTVILKRACCPAYIYYFHLKREILFNARIATKDLYTRNKRKIFDTSHCKKRLSFIPPPVGMSLTKLSLAGNNLMIPGKRVWLVTSRLGTGKSVTFFTVHDMKLPYKLLHRDGTKVQC
jgi:hypothetical protein